MTKDETQLVFVLSQIDESNAKAIILQSFIAEFGPLSDEAGKRVRQLLNKGESP